MLQCSKNAKRLSERGFTLVELLVTVSVIGILAAVAMPSVGWMTNQARLSGAADEMVATMQMARSEAVRLNTRMTVCGTADGTTCASSTTWTRWIIRGYDNVDKADTIIRDTTASGAVQVSGPADGIVFRPSGRVDTQQDLTVCIPTSMPPQNQRPITVMVSGVVSKKAPVNGGGACP